MTRRLTAPGLPGRDVALAVGFGVLMIGATLSGDLHEGPRALTIPVDVVSAAALLGRTRAPLATAVVVVVAGVTQAVLAHSPGSVFALGVYLVAAFAVGAHRDEGRSVIGGVVVIAGLCVQELLDHGSDYLFIVLVFGAAWLGGRGLHEWRERATYAEQHQRDLARLAVTDERLRIARELHDVVANALSVVAVQADGAEAALAKDPALAVEPLQRIRASARAALGEMRLMLTALRPTEDGLAPAKGIRDLPELVEAMQAAGLPLTAELPEKTLDCPSGVGLAAYRIVQEGLTNVLKHAGPVPTRLSVATGREGIALSVRNDPPPAPRPPLADGGQGLVGVRERVLATGGSFRAGPAEDGGFVLEASLPLADPA
jgi:signal transduction histidine kinase